MLLLQVVARQEAEMRARQEVSDALSRLRAKLDYEKERQAANGAAAAEVRTLCIVLHVTETPTLHSL